jgi:hypothetical protein
MDLYIKEHAYWDKEREKRAEEDHTRPHALLCFWRVGGGVSVNASMQRL